MKNCHMLWIVALSFALVLGCTARATPDDCNKACIKWSELETKANPPEDPVAKAEAEFKEKLGKVQAEQNAALAPIDAEYAPKLEAANSEEKKKAITAELNAKKTEKAKEFAPKFQKINAEKKKALTIAKSKREEINEKSKQAVADCKAQCMMGFSKDKTDCQQAAATLDAFKACK